MSGPGRGRGGDRMCVCGGVSQSREVWGRGRGEKRGEAPSSEIWEGGVPERRGEGPGKVGGGIPEEERRG